MLLLAASAEVVRMLPLLETRKGQGRSCTEPAKGELLLIMEVGVSGMGPGWARLLSWPPESSDRSDPDLEWQITDPGREDRGVPAGRAVVAASSIE